MHSHALPSLSSLDHKSIFTASATPTSSIVASDQPAKKTCKLFFSATHHNANLFLNACLKRIKAMPDFVVYTCNPAGTPQQTRDSLALQLLDFINSMSKTIIIEEVILVTEFNLGYSGNNVKAFPLVLSSLSTLIPQLMYVDSPAEFIRAKQQQKIPLKLFLQGAGGSDLKATDILDQPMKELMLASLNEGNIDPLTLAEYNFNKLKTVQHYLLSTGIPFTPTVTPKLKSRQLPRASSLSTASTPSSYTSSTGFSIYDTPTSLISTGSPTMNFPSSSPPALLPIHPFSPGDKTLPEQGFETPIKADSLVLPPSAPFKKPKPFIDLNVDQDLAEINSQFTISRKLSFNQLPQNFVLAPAPLRVKTTEEGKSFKAADLAASPMPAIPAPQNSPASAASEWLQSNSSLPTLFRQRSVQSASTTKTLSPLAPPELKRFLTS